MTARGVLAGDLGGTHARLALFLRDSAEPEWIRVEPSAGSSGFGEILRRALDATGARPEAASFGVPGPVRDGRSRTTNLPWEIDAAELSRACGIPRVALLNDLEAMAWGIETLAPSARVTLQEGCPDPRGNQALLAVGTGLGEAGLPWTGTSRLPMATEGGHASFAPADEEQDALLRFLRGRHAHVSWERVLSGPGLRNVFDFVVHERIAVPARPLLDELAAGADAGAISRAADEGDPAAAHALGMFVRMMGAEASNLALKLMATGGVFVGGGVPPKLRERLVAPGFLSAFLDKGRMRPLLQAMPVTLILDEQAALRGAARHARRCAE